MPLVVQDVGIRIPLSRGLFALVDEADFETVNQHKWFASKGSRTFYAARNVVLDGRRTVVRMHQVLLGMPKDVDIDHVNGDGLDNRRANLRTTSRSQNNFNQHRKQRGCSSKYRGVTWSRYHGKWQAQIKAHGKYKLIGRFDDELEAALAYDAAGAARDAKHFAPNFPGGVPCP